VLFATSLAQQVKHAPSVEQCRADQRVWMEKLEHSPSDSDYETLIGQASEMEECASVDSQNERRYHSVEHLIVTIQAARMMSFLARHDLVDKFLAEDRAGKR